MSGEMPEGGWRRAWYEIALEPSPAGSTGEVCERCRNRGGDGFLGGLCPECGRPFTSEDTGRTPSPSPAASRELVFDESAPGAPPTVIERASRAASPEAGEHDWHERFGLTCCRKCGIVQRADGRNKPCPGNIHVGLRAALSPAVPPEAGEALPVHGIGFDYRVGGFAAIRIGDVEYSAEAVRAALSPRPQPSDEAGAARIAAAFRAAGLSTIDGTWTQGATPKLAHIAARALVQSGER